VADVKSDGPQDDFLGLKFEGEDASAAASATDTSKAPLVIFIAPNVPSAQDFRQEVSYDWWVRRAPEENTRCQEEQERQWRKAGEVRREEVRLWREELEQKLEERERQRKEAECKES
jgi:hypothetical protein